jgi:anaphase-promoting complex subunit 1
MAGSGNLAVLRDLRAIDHQRRVAAAAGRSSNYGSHMALSMAIGFLFMGGGTCSLRRSKTAIAGLLCALYPLFPHRPEENRYHLQVRRWCMCVTQATVSVSDTVRAILLPRDRLSDTCGS